MSPSEPLGAFLVLASRDAFESLVGPVPEDLLPRFRFQKPRNAARIRSLLSRTRLVISKNYRRPEINRWIFAARRRGIPTLLVVDGPLEWANLYRDAHRILSGSHGSGGLFEPVVHDAVACIGPAQKRWIASRNEGRGIEWLTYSNRRIRPASAPPPSSPGNPANEVPEPVFDFLLTTAKTPYFDAIEKKNLESLLRACAKALEEGGHRVLIRIFDDDLREGLRSHAPSATFGHAGTSSEAIASAHCVIGTSSSLLLESMQQDKPTGMLVFRDSPLFYQTGWLFGPTDDWKGRFESMLSRDSQRMESQQHTLREHLSREDFFEHCRRIAAATTLTRARPLDPIDREFEIRVLRQVEDARRRFLSPILRALSPGRSKGP